MFVINGELVTAPLSDSILDGVTRDSLLHIAKDMGLKTAERQISVHELEKAFEAGTISEAFGAGTAAVVAPIKTISIKGVDHNLPVYTGNEMMYTLKDRLDNIRTGLSEDPYGWNFII